MILLSKVVPQNQLAFSDRDNLVALLWKYLLAGRKLIGGLKTVRV